jgi:hypothetical protein
MKKEEGMKSIKKIGILSVACILSILYAVVGFFQGILMFTQINNPAVAATMDSAVLEALSVMGPWLILILPVIFALMGFIGGLLASLLYNLIAKFTGGIKVKLQ